MQQQQKMTTKREVKKRKKNRKIYCYHAEKKGLNKRHSLC